MRESSKILPVRSAIFPARLCPALQQQSSLDDTTIVKGLKEALATGTERAVTEVARPDGYFGNSLIKILLPDKVQKAADLLATVGYQKQVNEFVLSMNRAAEAAAPKAAAFFGDAIRQMTVEDARGILAGGDTSATQFFEKKLRIETLRIIQAGGFQQYESGGYGSFLPGDDGFVRQPSHGFHVRNSIP